MTTAPSSNFSVFVLAQLQVAGLRLKLLAVEVDSITTALGGNFISADDAVAWAHEISPDLITASST